MTPKVTSTSDEVTIESLSADETYRVARTLGGFLSAGACVALYGDLGGGKTVFARGLVHGLGVPEETAVTSPTFVIVSEYEGRLPIHHVDAYRLEGAEDIVHLGSRELFYGDAVAVVEWADRIEGALPSERINVRFEVRGKCERRLSIKAFGEAQKDALAALTEALS